MQRCISKSRIHIHALVQDTDNPGPAIRKHAIEQEVQIDGELEDPRPDIVNRSSGPVAHP